MKHELRHSIKYIEFLYAWFPFVGIELMANVYRLSRVTGWGLDHVNLVILVFFFVGLLLSGFGFPKLIRYWLGGRKASFFSLILWIPYFMILTYIVVAMVSDHPSGRQTESCNRTHGHRCFGVVPILPGYPSSVWNGSITERMKEDRMT